MTTYEIRPHNRVLNHIALHVPDLEAAVTWYTTLFGFRRLRAPICCDRSTDPCAPIFRVYDAELHKFINPPMSEPAGFNYTRGGVFHLAVTDPDPEGLLERAKAMGARQIGEAVTPASCEGEGERQVALYMQDPWGNVIEACSCSFEKMMANRDK
ncbi:Glyoxalase/Bleomycin resistance protein/Dihydroxybiphenyl dioxygenase [Paraphaeosphaeria sporulosa]|uniref:Glyoxalase/Bleomycin resistance protein/Dihydroxybiphenyl dioxygenase n=1 Tax=Paraphaeosphaeria sporulosa TaxID=1460663 RepID=A0A177CGN4_9PLEO|nr:Glyoxalase/Bleomycin resistance protein/Dihydroxybiphenyl dioxygenase [Paraphaeosphaeria sporulosa]OAG06008.1 Glyoxalase/Bleomycin resistance protein/Dihydroxybiphenyl dioxygenase [Paraphaeosphaeria sporulosa]